MLDTRGVLLTMALLNGGWMPAICPKASPVGGGDKKIATLKKTKDPVNLPGICFSD